MSFLTDELLYQKTSQELTMLLYEACEQNIEEAIMFINGNDFIAANEKFKRAIDIIERLGVGLNYESGIIAEELDSLYNYMNEQLILANLKKDTEPAHEVLKLLNSISTAWNEAVRSQTDNQSAAVKNRNNAYEKNTLYSN